jgi:flagellar hook protein FlgE
VTQEFAQGGVDFTDRALDPALSGEGFFTVSDNGVVAYTRVGLVRRRSRRVRREQSESTPADLPAHDTGGFNTGTLEDLRLDADSPPQPTSTASFGINLAGQCVAAGRRFDPQRVDLQPFDGHLHFRILLGASHDVTGVLRQDGDRQSMGARFTSTARRRRCERDDLLERRRLTTPRRALHSACTPAFRRRRSARDRFIQSTQYGSALA